MGSHVELAPEAVPHGLAEALGHATRELVTSGLHASVTRRGDGFELILLAGGPRTAAQNARAEGMVTVRGLTADGVAMAVTWLRGAHAPVTVRLELGPAAGASFEARLAEVRRLL